MKIDFLFSQIGGDEPLKFIKDFHAEYFPQDSAFSAWRGETKRASHSRQTLLSRYLCENYIPHAYTDEFIQFDGIERDGVPEHEVNNKITSD